MGLQLIRFVYSGYPPPRAIVAKGISAIDLPMEWSSITTIPIRPIIQVRIISLDMYMVPCLPHIGPFKNHKGLSLVVMAREYPLNLSFIDYDPTHGKFKLHIAVKSTFQCSDAAFYMWRLTYKYYSLTSPRSDFMTLKQINGIHNKPTSLVVKTYNTHEILFRSRERARNKNLGSMAIWWPEYR